MRSSSVISAVGTSSGRCDSTVEFHNLYPPKVWLQVKDGHIVGRQHNSLGDCLLDWVSRLLPDQFATLLKHCPARAKCTFTRVLVRGLVHLTTLWHDRLSMEQTNSLFWVFAGPTNKSLVQ